MEIPTKHLPTGEAAVEEIDMISALHENILGHILSFIPIVDAVHTSVLSRRWIEVWKFITSLKFDDSLLHHEKKMPKQQFVDFVEKVLFQLTNSNIQSFSLWLTSYQYDASLITAWISFILGRRVQKLHIQYADKVFLSSNLLFTCDSLVELVLQMKCILSLPKSASLQNLQKLSISGIKLVSDSSDCSKDITLNFPILKVFEARGCEWLTTQNISLQVPLLERFSIAIWNRHSNESSEYAIKVYSQRLTDFTYEGDLEQDIILCDSSLIHNASIVIVVDEDKEIRVEKLGFQACNLLRQIHDVERLKLLFYKVLRHARDIFANLPVFGRLTYLELNEVNGEALLQLLNNSPVLDTLVLLNGLADSDKDVFTSAMVPQCFLSSFQVFQFNGFNANEHDLCLIKFILENATMLEKMKISPAFWLRYADIDLEKVKEKILSLEKCSNFCMIEFFDISGS
ncbi:F-box/FBD/LRR-repeat protein At3g14710-like [Vicia villosa]|uniref:F-box/FBD/LRR-repeat protein At3g14710-like n=1 Tax=Vicia villosa TaxID=3911 RepID=UPI00273C9786|nr:F-box/FBD/LRR-repeat protein At3g14710-like [Vicia villosa]XP_058773563.1 F-box/FBD/LRR-repeat protein At3g14710-like [Vicia villosa]